MTTNNRIDWDRLMQEKWKQALAKKKKHEKRNRIDHTYNIGDKVLIIFLNTQERRSQSTLHGNTYDIVTLKMNKSSYDQINHIRRIKPFYEHEERIIRRIFHGNFMTTPLINRAF